MSQAWYRAGIVAASVVAGLLTLVACLAGCEERGTPASGAGAGRLKIVATTGMIGDVAANIAGERAQVTTLMGEGVDPHLYKASPGDVRLLADADVIFYNGLHLEGRMADVIVKMAQKQTVVRVTEGIEESRLREPPEFAGHFDPQVWFVVMLWARAAERVRDALVEKDPAGRGVYEANAERYLGELRALDAWARETIATIPEQNRVMVTAHDAFGYFGAAYGLKVLGVQGISTDSEASLQDINGLVDLLVEGKVPAVFVESTVPRKTIDALIEGCRARGHTVAVGGELFSDAMGAEGTAEGTYIGMVRHNVDTVARALGGRVPPTAAAATPGTDAPAKTNP